MTQALTTGVTGLRAHQQQLDVVANNLANLNTIGFKAQSTVFSDLVYNTRRPGANPSQLNFGGINPQQIGTGVGIAQISRRFTQGTLQSTGELLDFAIQGEGFFTLVDPAGERVYSRAGSFALDGNGNLVDPGSGYTLERTGVLGEPTDHSRGFQVPGDRTINVPLGAAIPGSETTSIDFFGNLPSSASPPIAEVLSSNQVFETGSGTATLTTPLSDLTINTAGYVTGDVIDINGFDADGTAFSTTLTIGAVPADTTMQDLVDQINGALTGAVASLEDGQLTVTANDTGESFLGLVVDDAIGNTGASNYSSNSMIVSTEGQEGETFETTMEIYDQRGNDNGVRFAFQKVGTNEWSVEAALTTSDGTFIDNQVLNLRFNEDGTYALAGTAGDGDANIEIQFDSLSSSQTIDLNFGDMNHIATDFSLSQVQDGVPPGTLVSFAVSSTGELTGISSNGRNLPLAQLAIASFSNVGALESIGSNYFQESLNSGDAIIGSGLSGGRGQVFGGRLESSNVDIAQEFTRLIVAQRGFSANARTITIADEVLEELNNIVR